MNDCLISWRYNQETVIAGLPVRKSFEELPKVDEVIEFTPTITGLYGNGEESSREEKCSGKVLEVKKSDSKLFDYSLLLETVGKATEVIIK
jgi:hypothetical protein